MNERQRRKETLIQQLLKDKFEDAVGAPRESDTIQELVKLERALRDDGMAMESQRHIHTRHGRLFYSCPMAAAISSSDKPRFRCSTAIFLFSIASSAW